MSTIWKEWKALPEKTEVQTRRPDWAVEATIPGAPLVLPAVTRPLRPIHGTDIPRVRPNRTRRHILHGALALAALAAVTVGLRKLRPAAPTIERASVWTDTVRRGPMVREVLGQGTLVPEQMRWIAAPATARVDRVLAKPGAAVTADTVLVELDNSDVQLVALEAERQLAQAKAEQANLEALLNAQQLAQKSVIATLSAEHADASRRARSDQELSARGFIALHDLEMTRDKAKELAGRLSFERRRLRAHKRGMAAQLEAKSSQLQHMVSLVEFRRREVESLRVRAGVDGILQELGLQPGQAVTLGAPLAKVARPDRLQAEVRVPETQVKDVRVGQKAVIDTRNGLIPGRVSRLDPAALAGTVRVDVALEGALPPGARPDLNVEATIEIERLASVLHVGRPAFGQAESTVGIFRLEPHGSDAVRVRVKLGRSSVKSVEIREGLREGDRVILSDMAQWDHVARVRVR